jgi:hypothetical protein
LSSGTHIYLYQNKVFITRNYDYIEKATILYLEDSKLFKSLKNKTNNLNKTNKLNSLKELVNIIKEGKN